MVVRGHHCQDLLFESTAHFNDSWLLIVNGFPEKELNGVLDLLVLLFLLVDHTNSFFDLSDVQGFLIRELWVWVIIIWIYLALNDVHSLTLRVFYCFLHHVLVFHLVLGLLLDQVKLAQGGLVVLILFGHRT